MKQGKNNVDKKTKFLLGKIVESRKGCMLNKEDSKYLQKNVKPHISIDDKPHILTHKNLPDKNKVKWEVKKF